MSEQETLDPNVHTIATLLPWYLNGTLNEEERGQVTRHMADCEGCRAELEELTVLRACTKEVYATESVPSPQAFKSVMTQIASERKRAPATVTIGYGQKSVLEHVEGWVRTLFLPRWAPVLAATLIVGQLGLLLWTAQTPSTPVDVTTRSIPPVVNLRLRIAFHATAQEQQIRTILHELQGRLVDGPTSEGMYFVEVPMADSAGLRKTLEAIRSHAEVVKEVTPVQP